MASRPHHILRSTWQTLAVVLMLCAGAAQAQDRAGSSQPFGGAGASADSSARDTAVMAGLEYHEDVPDSVLRQKVFFYHYRPMQSKIYEVHHPTLDPTGAQFSDPLDALDGNYRLGKGVVGEPHIALFPTLAAGIAPRAVVDPLEGYAKTAQNVTLYQTLTPYTVLSYHSSLNEDHRLHVTHTQNIKPGWNAALDYWLDNPTGVYTNSAVKNHYLDLNSNYFSADSRLRLQGGIIWQEMLFGENGGLSDITYFTERTQTNRAGIPVEYDDAKTRHHRFQAFGHASYSLVRQFEYYRTHDSIVYEADSMGNLRPVDTLQLTDTLQPSRPRIDNAGRIGIDFNFDRQVRSFNSRTLWREIGGDVYWTNDIYMDHRWRNPVKITLGLKPRVVRLAVNNSAMSDSAGRASWLNPYAHVELAIGRGSLMGEAELAQGFDEGTDQRYVARLSWPFDTARTSMAAASIVMQQSRPDAQLLYDAYINQGFVPKTLNQFGLGLEANYRQWVEVKLRASHANHNIWYDSLLEVREGNDDFWLYQAALTARIKLGVFHLDMQQLLQYSTDSLQMPVPLVASKNSVYVDIHLFRHALRTQIGADLRFHTRFYAPAYDPSIGTFYHQDQQQVGGYLWADLFINLQIKRASIYLKAGHLNAIWDTSPDYFLLPNYPGQNFGLFWGLTWHFFD